MKYIAIVLLLVIVSVSCDHRKDLADAYGNFEVDDVVVSAEASGKLLRFAIQEGIDVVRDQLVGQIDTLSVKLQLAQLDAQVAAVKTKVASVNAQIASQQQQKANLQVKNNRIEKLLTSGAATQQQFDDLDGQLKLVDKQISASKTQISSIAKEIDVLLAQKDMVLEQLKKCSVVVPVNGVVLEKYVEEGELVVVGKPLLKVADISELNLRCYVSGDQLYEIELGKKVKVTVDGGLDEMIELDGRVVWISAKSEFTPKIIQTKEERVKLVYAVKVVVQNNGQLKLGMPGEMRIIR